MLEFERVSNNVSKERLCQVQLAICGVYSDGLSLFDNLTVKSSVGRGKSVQPHIR